MTSVHARIWAGRILPPALTIGSILLVWQLAVVTGHISERVLSSPTEIAASMVSTWPELMDAAATTTYEALTGFGIAVACGIAIGIGLYLSRSLNRALYPLLVAAQTVPLITIAPLFMLWFGFAITGKIILVAIFSVFPIAVQTCRGLTAVPQWYGDVALTCGATRSWLLWHVKLRVAGRQIFGGIRISAAYVFGTAVMAEYLGSMNGFGIWLQGALNSFRTTPIFSATVVIIAETAILLAAIGIVEHLVLGPPDER